MLAADAATGDDVKITQQEDCDDGFRGDEGLAAASESVDISPASDLCANGDSSGDRLASRANCGQAERDGASDGRDIAAARLDAPQPVENGEVESRFTTDAVASEKLVSPKLKLVKSGGETEADEVKKLSPPVFSTSGKPVSALFTVPLQVKWVVEWKTTSKNRRELIYHLKWLDGATWKPVTRKMVERGEIQVEGKLILSIRKFTPDEAAKIERLGRDAVKRYVGLIIERNKRDRLRRAG